MVDSQTAYGRQIAANVIRVQPGVTAYGKKAQDPVSAWNCIIDDGMVRQITKFTNEYAATQDPEWTTDSNEILRFIGYLLFYFYFIWSYIIPSAYHITNGTNGTK